MNARAVPIALFALAALAVVVPIGTFDPTEREPDPRGSAQACAALDTDLLDAAGLSAVDGEPPERTTSDLDVTYPLVDESWCDLIHADDAIACSDGVALREMRSFVLVLRTDTDAAGRFTYVQNDRVSFEPSYRSIDLPDADGYSFLRDDGTLLALGTAGRVIFGVQGGPCEEGDDAWEEIASWLRSLDHEAMVST